MPSSTQLDVKVYKNGHIHFQEYKRGVVVADLAVIGETEKHGTTVHFTPDPEIFQETTEFDFGKLAKRIQELAFLNKGSVSLSQISVRVSNKRNIITTKVVSHLM